MERFPNARMNLITFAFPVRFYCFTLTKQIEQRRLNCFLVLLHTAIGNTTVLGVVDPTITRYIPKYSR